jgi:predicted TIM-barrel fold metal-dependent hydrolase
MRTTTALVFLILGSTVTFAQDRLPIIDMHLHALAADSQGPPPLGICAPFEEFPTWDPGQPYEATFIAMLKQPSCADPVWSPETDEEVMQQTIEVMKRRNIIGILSGSLERVARWRTEAFDRIIPAVMFNLARDTDLTPEVLRRNVESNRVQVLSEITNQYEGIAPDDERMEPYWTLAEELDIPAGIHIGPGPPGVRYMGASGYRLHHARWVSPTR